MFSLFSRVNHKGPLSPNGSLNNFYRVPVFVVHNTSEEPTFFCFLVELHFYNNDRSSDRPSQYNMGIRFFGDGPHFVRLNTNGDVRLLGGTKRRVYQRFFHASFRGGVFERSHRFLST